MEGYLLRTIPHTMVLYLHLTIVTQNVKLTHALTNKYTTVYKKFLSLTMKDVHERDFSSFSKETSFTENILLAFKYFIKNLSLFLNETLRHGSLQSYIQNFSLQVI
jgi:hypothetical protein